MGEVDNALRKPVVIEINVGKALSKSGLPDLDYALNPYIGCWHACTYCYARLYTGRRDVSENWGDIIYVKKNLPIVLEREVKMYRRGVVGIGTITDPYQPVEAIYGITRKTIIILAKNGFHVSIQTKNSLILRDIDTLSKYRKNIDVGLTITFIEDSKARLVEPRATPPTMRVKTLKILSINDIETWIFYGPVIPGLNDDKKTIHTLLKLALETNSKLLIDKLHIKRFMYSEDNPLYKYVWRTRKYNWNHFYNEILKLCDLYGVKCYIGLGEPSEQQKYVSLEEYFVK